MPRYFRHIDMKRFLLFFSALSFLVSCHHAMIDANQVEQIVFYPIPKGTEYCASLSCFRDVLRANGRDTVVVDQSDIREFCRLLNSLEFDEDFVLENLGESFIMVAGQWRIINLFLISLIRIFMVHKPMIIGFLILSEGVLNSFVNINSN